jgi:hypothetical protein
MAERDDAAATTFEEQRSYLFSIAYRMLGSVSDAEDAVQDAFVRWQRDSRRDGKAYGAVLVDLRGDRVHVVYGVLNPDKLTDIDRRISALL